MNQYIEEIKNKYYGQGLSATEIAKQYGVSHTAILDCLERHGCKRRDRSGYRQHAVDDSYFEKIDTAEKAYWLGFLYADGYNCRTKHYFVLKLKEEDKYILEKLKTALKYNNSVKTGQANGKVQYYLRIHSRKISTDLERLGMTQGKSLTLEPPTEQQVEKKLIHHFVRGYFDGDGCVTMNKNRPTHVQINFCLTLSFGKWINKILATELGIKGSIYKQDDNAIHHLAFCGRHKVTDFMDWMYEDADGLFLIRKHEKYQRLKAYNPKKLNTSSQYMGVYFCKRRDNFQAYLTINGKREYVGYFDNEKAAAEARDKRIDELGLNAPRSIISGTSVQT